MTASRHSDPVRAPSATPDCQTAFVGLCRAVDCVTAIVETVVEPHGITGQQYNVLRILQREPAGLPTLAVAERMIDRAPGITRMMDRLEAKGLVERERSGEDRRLVRCRITENGLALLEKVAEPLEKAKRSAFAGLRSEEVEQLVTLLARMTINRKQSSDDL
jgi:DNA-binding MarR family transcriptional regulator